MGSICEELAAGVKEESGMKMIAIAAALLAWIVAAGAEPSSSQSSSRSFYDQRGSFAGSATTRGNETSFSDQRGRFAGSAIKNSDGTTSFYDRNGRFTGSMPAPTPRR
jgi:hypothetical protein